jgi:Family of unknown function (DUF6263)
MKQIRTSLVAAIALFGATTASAQKISGKITLAKGQKIEAVTTSKTNMTQEAMGQTMESSSESAMTNTFEVTAADAASASLTSKINRIVFNMSAMGQEMSYDSDKKEDRDGRMSEMMNNYVDKTYDMTIDNYGTVTNVQAPKAKDAEAGGMMENMIETMLGKVETPKAGGSSFFKILPGRDVKVGDTWMDSTTVDGTTTINNYTLKEIKGLDAIVMLNSTINMSGKRDVQGNEMTFNFKNTATGEIIIDAKTGLVKQKTTTTTTNGNVEVMGMSIPITGTATAVTMVKVL